MTFDQVLTIIATLGGYFIAAFTIWYQGKREVDKAKLQRTWTIEDRNLSRAWQQADKRIELRKVQLQPHQEFVETFLKAALDQVNRTSLATIEVGDALTLERYMKDMELLMSKTAELMFHIGTFGNAELTKELKEFLTIRGETITIHSQAHEDYRATGAGLVFKLSSRAAEITRKMEAIVIEEIRQEEQGLATGTTVRNSKS